MQLVIAILIVIAAYLVQQRLYKRLWNKNLDVDIRFMDEYVAAGEKTGLIEVINNAKFLPLPVFHVKFSTSRTFSFTDSENASVTDSYHRNDVFSVMGNRRITRTLEFVTRKRGYYTISGVNIVARDFFMTGNFARMVENHTSLYVFPGKLKDERLEIIFRDMLGEMEARRSLWDDPFHLSGLREYYPGDGMRKINWKATAKTGDLMVNLYHPSAEQRVKILLNMETNIMIRTEYIQEVGIELASAAAQFFLSNKIPVMLESNGLDLVTGSCGRVEFGASENHMISINKYLARIDQNAGLEAFFEILEEEIACGDESISYVIVSSYHKEDLLLKLDYMVKKGIPVSMICPYYDIERPEKEREYLHGWEVRFNET